MYPHPPPWQPAISKSTNQWVSHVHAHAPMRVILVNESTSQSRLISIPNHSSREPEERRCGGRCKLKQTQHAEPRRQACLLSSTRHTSHTGAACTQPDADVHPPRHPPTEKEVRHPLNDCSALQEAGGGTWRCVRHQGGGGRSGAGDRQHKGRQADGSGRTRNKPQVTQPVLCSACCLDTDLPCSASFYHSATHPATHAQAATQQHTQPPTVSHPQAAT
jgi:hypothetical protein